MSEAGSIHPEFVRQNPEPQRSIAEEEGHNFKNPNLVPCIQCNAPAVEQIRCLMGPGDYKEVQYIDHKGHHKDDVNFYKKVWLDDYNRNDLRISCNECDNATPWMRKDVEGLKGAGLDFCRKTWNLRNTKQV